MLKLKYLNYDEELAEQGLKLWKKDDEKWKDFFQYFRVSANAIYPFPGENGLCFLRLAPAVEKRIHNLQGEIEFIEYLCSKEYPALKPIKSLDGNYVETIVKDNEKYYVSAFEGVKGKPIKDIEITEHIIFEYGKTLGKLNALSASYIPSVKKWSHVEVLDWIYEELEKQENQELARKEWKALEQELGKLSITEKNYGLTHHDFEIDNVFYDAEATSCNVIDFEDSMYHWFGADIDIAFESLLDLAQGDEWENYKKIFLEGYQTEYSLDNVMMDYLPLFHRFHDLLSYAKILHTMSEKVENEPDWMFQIEKKLTSKMQTIQAKWLNL